MGNQFAPTFEDIEDVKAELEENVWSFVRWDIAVVLIETGEYRRMADVFENAPMNFIPLTKA